ncbi:DUF2487 family protein [Paenibacillus methanolicus]|uniref:Uncharacterized protein DUF2487 n=1 Tax=Paenibacillus methanolicus TaxID=582686 RepID=A0A5S5CGW6_9BACL|nr:DUF2487 family protein [Paenibacillus methanolicus]TYP77742.1 uncharacterized protein DUF2487 [Paenibacillus methanolicus]
MKFSELTPDQWAELAPYLDTAVLPVTGLIGNELPFEATEALERLRDVLDRIEQPFKGRIVTYPSCQYADRSDGAEQVEQICANLKAAGFKYVFLAAAFNAEAWIGKLASADLIVGTDAQGNPPQAEEVSAAVRKLWLGR